MVSLLSGKERKCNLKKLIHAGRGAPIPSFRRRYTCLLEAISNSQGQFRLLGDRESENNLRTKPPNTNQFGENPFLCSWFFEGILTRIFMTLPRAELGGGGDGVEFARGFPQRDVGFEFAHHFVETG
jgi:hypothetical protein